MAYQRGGIICFALAAAAWAVSLPLRCAWLAAVVAGLSVLGGALCGVFLALVTRTRRPVLIYVFLAGAGAMVWPLYAGWPYADAFDILAWPGAPQIVYSYFAVLRPFVFLLGLPIPFALLGQHGPDPLPVTTEQTAQTAPQQDAQNTAQAQNTETETAQARPNI